MCGGMCKMTKEGYEPYDQVMINPNIGIGALVDVAPVANENLGGQFWERTSCAMKLRSQHVMVSNILATEFRLLKIYQWFLFPSFCICILLEYSIGRGIAYNSKLIPSKFAR